MENQQLLILGVGLVFLLAITVWPQWRARRQREKQRSELRVGDEVMTVGGIVGRIAQLDTEQDRASIEIAPGVEMTIALAAISRTLAPAEDS
jgi:preprotein translocase subunit YajC